MDNSNVHPAYQPDASGEERAKLIEAAVASLKLKLGTISPPVEHGAELLALANVAALMKNSDAVIVPHPAFTPSTAGSASSVEGALRNMASAAAVNQSPTSSDDANKEAPVSKDGATLGAAKAGDFEAINLGSAKKVEEVNS